VKPTALRDTKLGDATSPSKSFPKRNYEEDGQRFSMIEGEASQHHEIRVVLNWFE